VARGLLSARCPLGRRRGDAQHRGHLTLERRRVCVAIQCGYLDARRVPSWALGAGNERLEGDGRCLVVGALDDLVDGWVLGAPDTRLAGSLERLPSDVMATRLRSALSIRASSTVETVLLAPPVLLLRSGVQTWRHRRGRRHQRVVVGGHRFTRVARVVRGVEAGGACRA
jgi:hypothetical protein